MTLIDLGDIAERSAPPHAGHPLDRRTLRWIALIVLTLCTTVLVTASERPRQHGLRPLWSAPLDADGGSMVLTADSVYAYEGAGDQIKLTARDLRTGAVRWSEPAGVEIDPPLPLASTSGMLLLPVETFLVEADSPDGGTSATEYIGVTAARRSSTGAEAWRSEGEILAIADDTVLMGVRDRAGRIARVRLARLADGTTVWTTPTPGVRSWAVDYAGTRPQHLITATDQGDIKIYPYATGAAPRTGRLPWVASPDNAVAGTELFAGDGYLITSRLPPTGNPSTTVYDLRTLAEVWHPPGNGDVALPCGATLVCAITETGVTGYDTTSRRELWRLPGIRTARPIRAGRLLAGTDPELATYRLLDARTGRLLGPAVIGVPLTPSGGGPRSPSASIPADELLALAPVRENLGRTAVIQLDLISGRQYLLGSIERVADDDGSCEAVPGYLVCLSTGRREMRVTAVG